MNMKKTLAGVMAGAMAVSAMAATVSADQEEISLTYDLKRYAPVSEDGTVTITSEYTTTNNEASYLVPIDSNGAAVLKFEAQQKFLKDKDLVSAKITVNSKVNKLIEMVDANGKLVTQIETKNLQNTIKYTNDAAVAEKDSEYYFAPKGMIDTDNDGVTDFTVFSKDTDGDGYKEVYIPLRNDASRVRVINASDYKLDGVNAFGFVSCKAEITYKIPAKIEVRTADGWNLWQANGDYINWGFTDGQYDEIGIKAYSTVTNALKYMNEGLSCGDEAFRYDSNALDKAEAKQKALKALNDAKADLKTKEAALTAAEKALADAQDALNKASTDYADAVKNEKTTADAAKVAIKAANAKLYSILNKLDPVPDDKIVEPKDIVGTDNVEDVNFEAYSDWLELKTAAEAAQKAAIDATNAVPVAAKNLEDAKAAVAAAQAVRDAAKADRDAAQTAVNNAQAYYDSINDNVAGVLARPEKYSATSLVAGTTKDAVYPFKTVLNPTYSTKYDTNNKVITVGNNDVIAALKCRKADGNYYTNPIAVLNDAIANNEEVTFTFKTFTDYVATQKSHQYLQWVEADRAYGYKTSQYDWYNPAFSQHLYTNEYDTYSPFGVTNYDQYGSYSSAWGINLFSGAIVVNSGLTMQLNDTQKFYWGNDTLTFDWFTITDEGKITDAKTFLTSMLLYTPVDWYWDSLTVTVGNTEEDNIDTESPIEDDATEIPEEEEEIIFEEEEVVEEEVVEEEEEVVEPEETEEVEEVVEEVEEVQEVVEETKPVEPAGSPATGNSPIALAVIPVALAAAAVVAKKRG